MNNNNFEPAGFFYFALHKLCQLIMNKQSLLFFLLIVLYISFFSSPAVAQYRSFGIGGMIGSPTGISVKKWLSRRSAYDLGIAWSLSKNPGMHLHGDFLVHRSDFDGTEAGRSYVYYGLGGRLKAAADDPRAGARFPLGFTFIDTREPFDTFIEIVPVLDILPRTRLALNVSVGGRLYLSGRSGRY